MNMNDRDNCQWHRLYPYRHCKAFNERRANYKIYLNIGIGDFVDERYLDLKEAKEACEHLLCLYKNLTIYRLDIVDERSGRIAKKYKRGENR